MRKIMLGIMLFIFIASLTGCVKIPIGDGNSLKLSKDGITVSDADGNENTVNIDQKDEESFSLSFDGDEEGSWEASFGEDVELPDDFPVKDLPIPKEATIMSAQTLSSEEGDGSIVMYVYEGDINSLTQTYLDNFEKGSFKEIENVIETSAESGGFASLFAIKDDKSYFVQIIEDDGNLQVSLMYGEEID